MLIIGFILLAYGLAVLINSNGIIAAFFMGFFLGNSSFTAKQGVTNFLASISTLSNVTLPHARFAGIPEPIPRYLERRSGGRVSSDVYRPANSGSDIHLAVQVFAQGKGADLVGGIKGAVPIVLATYPAAANLDNDGLVFNIIFFAVLLTCIVQG